MANHHARWIDFRGEGDETAMTGAFDVHGVPARSDQRSVTPDIRGQRAGEASGLSESSGLFMRARQQDRRQGAGRGAQALRSAAKKMRGSLLANMLEALSPLSQNRICRHPGPAESGRAACPGSICGGLLEESP